MFYHHVHACIHIENFLTLQAFHKEIKQPQHVVLVHKTAILTHTDNHIESLSALHCKHTHTVYALLCLGNCLCPLSPQVFLPDLRDDVVGFF